jgi:hypothetical protein
MYIPQMQALVRYVSNKMGHEIEICSTCLTLREMCINSKTDSSETLRKKRARVT